MSTSASVRPTGFTPRLHWIIVPLGALVAIAVAAIMLTTGTHSATATHAAATARAHGLRSPALSNSAIPSSTAAAPTARLGYVRDPTTHALLPVQTSTEATTVPARRSYGAVP